MSDELFSRIVAIRRDLHRHPELSEQELETANKVCAYLDKLGIEYQRNIAGHGILAEIPCGRTGAPTIALRADMDALPIFEQTGLDFSSANDGVMHACAHDGHMSILLGAAELILQETDLPVNVRLVFQPAEEIGKGAKDMVAAGAIDGVSAIFGGHLDRHYPLNTLIVTDGAVNASSDKFRLEIKGTGGHAGRPHEAVDAVVIGSLLVMSIQTIVSREVNPAHPSVVTVGRFDAGTAANVIAGHAVLEGSIRAQETEVQMGLHDSIKRICASVAQLHCADISVEIEPGTPVLKNPPRETSIARAAATKVVGEENVRKMEIANMGGEDFSYYMQQVPGCYIRIGTTVEGVEAFPAHSDRFDFDERAMMVGARYYHSLVMEVGGRLAQEGTL